MLSRLMQWSKRLGVTIIALSAASLLVACSDGKAPASTFEYALQGLYSATFSDDGRFAVVGTIQHGGSLWDVQRQERLYDWNHKQGQYSNIVAAAISPNNAYALTADQQTLVLWNINSGEPHWFWAAPAGISSLDVDENADRALLGLENHTAVLFDVKNGGVVQTLYDDGPVSTVALHASGRYALTGSDNYEAKFWDVETGKVLHSLSHENSVNTVALSDDGRYAFSAGQLEKAHIWDTSTGAILHTLSGGEALFVQRFSYTQAVFSPDSRQLLTGNSQGIVQLWNVADGSEVARWQVYRRDKLRPTASVVFALAFGPDSVGAISSNGFYNQLR